MKAILISIVMPVYDPPLPRLERAVESVLAQTLDAWELIVVDDGSAQADICDFLERLGTSDSRIRVMAQENSGPSAARNRGTAAARGAYVTYLDSDDELTPFALENGSRLVVEHDLDLLLAHVQYLRDDASKRSSVSDEVSFFEGARIEQLHTDVLRGRPRLLEAGEPSIRVKNGPVARLVRREIAQRLNFPVDVPVSEDTIWNLALLNTVERAAVVDSIWYWYWVGHASTSRAFRANAYAETKAFLAALDEELGKSRFSVRREDVAARVLGEVNRAARLFFSHPNCQEPRSYRARGLRELIAVPILDRSLTWRPVVKAGAKPLIKYVLFRSGLAAYLPARLLRGSGTSSSISNGKDAPHNDEA